MRRGRICAKKKFISREERTRMIGEKQRKAQEEFSRELYLSLKKRYEEKLPESFFSRLCFAIKYIFNHIDRQGELK